MKAAGREAHGVGGLADKREPLRIRPRHLFERRRGAGRVSRDALQVERGVAPRLGFARRGDPRGDLGRAFGGGRIRSEAVTAGTSMIRSMRSSSGPEIRAWYCAMQ